MRRFAFIAVFAALAALGAWIAGQPPIAPKTPEQSIYWNRYDVERASRVEAKYDSDEAYFYRFRAGFRVKETGEQIDFDYVVVCHNIRLTRWADGTQTDFSPFGPHHMVQATRGGQAVLVQTLKACSGLTSDNDDVPHDVLPTAAWFDSVDDLSVGIGYMGEDAYENPLAKLQFLGARVDRATRAEWEAWRQKAAADYVQRGELPGPWGPESDTRFDWPTRSGRTAERCYGYKRVKLIAGVREKIRALWPSERPRFWAIPIWDSTKILDLLSFDPVDPSLYSLAWLHRFGTVGQRTKGLPIRSGRQMGPAPHLPVSWPAELYPLSTPSIVSAHPLRRVPPSPAVESYANKLEFREGALKGFAVCLNSEHGRAVKDADAQWITKRHVLMVDDVVVGEWRNDRYGLLQYDFIFERDEYMFGRYEAPL